MLKIVYPICCGLDVHRDFVYACIATTKNGVTTYKSHRFSTFTKGLRELLSWLLSNNCKDICMESTGKYWIPVYNILETDCKIVLAHPKYSKQSVERKPTKRMLNGLPTSSSTTWFPGALFLLRISVSFGTWFATIRNLRALLQEKRIVYKTVLPYLI